MISFACGLLHHINILITIFYALFDVKKVWRAGTDNFE